MIDSVVIQTNSVVESKEEEPTCCPPVEDVPCSACYEKTLREKKAMEEKEKLKLEVAATLNNMNANNNSMVIIEKKIQDLEAHTNNIDDNFNKNTMLMGAMLVNSQNTKNTLPPIHDLTESALSLQRVPPPSQPHPHADSPPSNITNPKAYIRNLPNPDSSTTHFNSTAVSSMSLTNSQSYNSNSGHVANITDAQPIGRIDNAHVSYIQSDDTAAKAAMSYFAGYSPYNEQPTANTTLMNYSTGLYPATASLQDASLILQSQQQATSYPQMIPSYGTMNGMNVGVMQPVFFVQNPALTTISSLYPSNAAAMFGTMSQQTTNQFMTGSIPSANNFSMGTTPITMDPSGDMFRSANSPISANIHARATSMNNNTTNNNNNNNNNNNVNNTNVKGSPNNLEKMVATYKTEICRSHQITGICEYGTDCQFSHGLEELRTREVDTKYKTERCKNYHTVGPSSCWYGSRCKFIHDEYRVRVGEYEFWLISPGDNIVRIERVERGNTPRIAQLQQLISEQNGIAATASAALTSQLHVAAAASTVRRGNNNGCSNSPSSDQTSHNIREIVAANLLRSLVVPSSDIYNASPAMNVQAMHVSYSRGLSASNSTVSSPTNASSVSSNTPISPTSATPSAVFSANNSATYPTQIPINHFQNMQMMNYNNPQISLFNSYESHINQLSRLVSKATLRQGHASDLLSNYNADEMKKKKRPMKTPRKVHLQRTINEGDEVEITVGDSSAASATTAEVSIQN